MVQIKDKSVKIGIQGNFSMLILKQLGYTLNVAQEGHNLNFKTADIEILNLRYNPILSARKHTFMKLMIIIVKIIYDIGKSFQIQDGSQIYRFWQIL